VALTRRGQPKQRTWTWQPGLGFEQVFNVVDFPIVTYAGEQRCDSLLPPEQRPVLLPDFDRRYQAALREWRPVASIRALVDELASGFGEHCIGVHVRRGDAWGNRHHSEFMRSTEAAFMAAMEQEIDRCSHTRFFLATDCATTEETFRCRYGQRLMVNTAKRFVPSIRKAPKDNQRDAAIDMFALSRTRKLLGNNYSSFSRMAASIGGIEFVRALEAA
jgi:hypothetical protein